MAAAKIDCDWLRNFGYPAQEQRIRAFGDLHAVPGFCGVLLVGFLIPYGPPLGLA